MCNGLPFRTPGLCRHQLRSFRRCLPARIPASHRGMGVTSSRPHRARLRLRSMRSTTVCREPSRRFVNRRYPVIPDSSAEATLRRARSLGGRSQPPTEAGETPHDPGLTRYRLSGPWRRAPHQTAVPPPLPYPGCFSALASTGILRRRIPVAAKIAFAMAGTIPEVPVSPMPPGGSELLTTWTSIAGAWFMRIIW